MHKLFTGYCIIILFWLTGCTALVPNQAGNNTTLFIGKNHANGTQLWQTDGTRSGTRILTRLNNNAPASAEIRHLVSLGKVAVFSAYHPKYGRELWRTDGTDAGTQLLVDTLPGPASSISEEYYGNLAGESALINKRLFFWVKTASN
ncbi:MAG: hypothetical protein R3E89_09930 [Thiolinea sp.]